MSKIIFTFRWVFVGVTLLSMLVVISSFAKEQPDKKKRNSIASLHKSTGDPRYQILNINNLWTWMRADGYSNHSPIGDNGTYFPRGTAWVIYLDGIMWGGKCYTDVAMTTPAPYDQLIRVGGSHYDSGVKEGHVIGMGATAAPSDPADARIYRIRRDYASMDPEELKRDAAEYNEIGVDQVSQAEIDEIYAWYERDWTEWPVELGAPFIDRNGNGMYDSPPPFSNNFIVDSLISGGYDEPGLAGVDPYSPADQVIWTVYNDLDRDQTLSLHGSEPMGIEVQVTIWGYKGTVDAFGDLFFRRVKLINKGGAAIDSSGTIGSFWIDSMYVAQWSDPDLGTAGDDLVGCDTTLNMGFVYNGNAFDWEYQKFNLPPPSAGYDFLQGPAIPSSGDSAIFDLKRKYDYKNLDMTSFSYFSAGSAISDPPGDYTRGTLRWYKMLRGYAPLDGPVQFYPFPPGMNPNKFPLSGDPVNGTGFLDGLGEVYSFSPGDRRFNCSTGPFMFAPGDTQEIVIAFVCGLGADRMSSISVMKFSDRLAQSAFNALFKLPKRPVVDAGGPYTGLAGEVIQFDGSRSYDPDGRIVKYHWDFGDGSYAGGDTLIHPVHVYGRASTYYVVLTVTDNDTLSGIDRTNVLISSTGIDVGHNENLPDRFGLSQNYPNPFNLATVIRYQIPKNGHVDIKIYNMMGQQIRILVDEKQKADSYKVNWDGKDNAGNTVSSGVYYYIMKSGSYIKMMKAVFLK